MNTDSVSDLLTRIRNAQRAGHAVVKVPKFKLGEKVLGLLKKEGFIESYEEENTEKVRGSYSVVLKYYSSGRPVMATIKRVSKPGCRTYKQVDDLPNVMCGLGMAIVSTSHGIMSDREARRRKVSGEVIALIG